MLLSGADLRIVVVSFTRLPFAHVIVLWTLCAALAFVQVAPAQERVGEIAVAVRDPVGRPLPGAEVVASSGDWQAATTDATGPVLLRVTPGTYEVVVAHAELAVLPTAGTVTVRSGESRTVEFRALPRSVGVTGKVRFRSEPPTALSGLHAAAYSGDPADGTYPVSVAPLAEDESFSLTVPPGRWRIGLLEIPQGIAVREVVTGQGRESRVELEVDFRTLTGVTGLLYEAGLVTERLGPAFSLTTVGLYAIGTDGQHRVLATAQARSDQRYALLAQAPVGAPLAAFAWRPGGLPVPAAVRSHAGSGSVSFVDFRFVPTSGVLVGTVVDTAGRRLPEAWVTAVSAVRYEDWMMWGRPVHALDGTFRLRVPQGPVLVRAWRDSRRLGAPQRVSIGDTGPTTVRLEAP